MRMRDLEAGTAENLAELAAEHRRKTLDALARAKAAKKKREAKGK